MGGGGAGSPEAGSKFRHAGGRGPGPQLCWPVQLLSDSTAWAWGWGRGPPWSWAPKSPLGGERTPCSLHALSRHPCSPPASACSSGESGASRKCTSRFDGHNRDSGPVYTVPKPRSPQPAPKAHLYSPSPFRVRGCGHRYFSGFCTLQRNPEGGNRGRGPLVPSQ